jgi:DNA replication protein DnaC
MRLSTAARETDEGDDREAPAPDPRVERNFRNSGMSARHRLATFGKYRVDKGSRAAYDAANAYVRDFASKFPYEGDEPEDPRNGLYVYGRVGSGKTFLAACVANALLADGWSAAFMTVGEMLGLLRRAAGAENRDDAANAGYWDRAGGGELLRRFKRAPLLVMDDMGKEKPTEWAVGSLYEIIDARYSNMLPTVITTNYSPDELQERLSADCDGLTAAALVDRLREMCLGLLLRTASRRRA